MNRFGRILVVLEAHEPAVGARGELLDFARANAAELTIAGLAGTPDPSLLRALFGGRDHRDGLRAGIQKALTGCAAPFTDAGLMVTTEVIEGDPLEGICELARTGRFDLVAKFAEGQDADTPYTFGPLDRGLLRQCHLPVLIANPRRNVDGRVLVAVDVNNPDYGDLNRELLDIGIDQARLAEAELHVVHAWHLEGETALRSGAFTEVNSAKIESLREAERRKRHEAVQALLGADPDGEAVDVVEHLVEGSPPKAITAVAKSVNADLLVMGATPRRRIASLILGDCAEAVLCSVASSVLLVKSPDLVAALRANR